MAKAAPLVMRDFSGGIQTGVNSGLIGASALRYTVNMYNDNTNTKIGSLTSRQGIDNVFGYIDTDIAAVDPDDQIIGLHGTSDGRVLAAVYEIGVATNVYIGTVLAATWLDVGTTPFDWDSSRVLRFCSFVGYVFAGNYTYFKSWNKVQTADWGTTNLTSAPSNVNLLKQFQGKLFVSHDLGTSTIYFSSIPDITTNLITWDTTNQKITINPSDEDRITALEPNGSLLIIFKEKVMYTYDGYATQSSPLYYYGAVSQEVVQTIKGSTLFLSQGVSYLSVYLYDGAEPIDVSEPVRDFLKTSNHINSTVFAEFGSWKDLDNYYLSIGDVTIDGYTFYNTVLCFNVEKKSWTVLSIGKKIGTYNNFFKHGQLLSGDEFTSNTLQSGTGATYNLHYTVIAGSSLGTTSTTNTGISPVLWKPSLEKGDDVGEATNNSIDIYLQTHELEFGSRSLIKTIQKFNVFASGNYGCVVLQCRIDGSSWVNVNDGALTGKTTTFDCSLVGHYFEFRLIGSNSGEPFVFEGFEFFRVDIEDYET